MTTAHRPTFNSVIATDTPGGNRLGVGTQHISARNLPGEMNLKYRTDLKDKKVEAPKDEKEEKKAQAMPKRDVDIALESSDDESDADSDELERELAKIKEERKQEALKKQRADKAREDAREEEAIAKGLAAWDMDTDTFATKRRWDDDVLFRNQTRTEPEAKRRFINDTVRSDFHRKFMAKYIQ